MNKTVNIEEIRNAIADYMFSEGCSCCRDLENHKKNEKRLAELLEVPMYADESGYEFDKFNFSNRKKKFSNKDTN